MPKGFKAYVDASGNGDPDLLAIAGYVAPTDVWETFSKEWRSRLEKAGIRSFKMSQMTSRMEIAAHFYRLIEAAQPAAAISCVIHTRELRQAVRNFPWPPEIRETARLENPYFFGFRAITDVFAQYQEHMKINEPVDFIFDDESEKILLHDAWDWMKLASARHVRRWMGNAPLFLKDDVCMPLQAADLYAWWVRKWQIEGNADGVAKLDFPWRAHQQIPRLHMEFREEHFLGEFARGLRPEARARWAVTDPKAALREQEEREAGIAMTLPDPSSPLAWRS